MVTNQLTVSNCIHACYTYCNIGVYFVFLPIFTDEPAAEFVHTRRHYLKSLMALREDGLKSFYLLLKGVQTSHLGEQTKVPDPKFFGGACSKKYSSPKEARRTRWLPDKMATATDGFGQSRAISFDPVTDASTEQFKYSWRPSGTAVSVVKGVAVFKRKSCGAPFSFFFTSKSVKLRNEFSFIFK